MGLAQLRVRGQAAVQYRVLLRALGLNIHRVAAWRESFYPQKLFGRLLSGLAMSSTGSWAGQTYTKAYQQPVEARTTRVCRWLCPLLSRLFSAPSTFDNSSDRTQLLHTGLAGTRIDGLDVLRAESNPRMRFEAQAQNTYTEF